MTQIESHSDSARREARALRLGMASNLILGAAGVVASVLSGSQAILVDGLFSLVGFFAAFIALGVTARATRAADRVRPFGYAMDEAIFSTFRALALFGLVLIAGTGAMVKIVKYIGGDAPAPIDIAPIGGYLAFVLLVCGGMWIVHHRTWVNTGRRSDVLKLEASAVAFDALMTVAAGMGFLFVHLAAGGPLDVLTPIGDSLIVLVLCSLAAVAYFQDFRRGLGELAGVTADPKIVLQAGRILRATLPDGSGRLVDFSVVKSGRLLTVIAYLDPVAPMNGAQVDALTKGVNAALSETLGRVETVVVISEFGRVLPQSDG